MLYDNYGISFIVMEIHSIYKFLEYSDYKDRKYVIQEINQILKNISVGLGELGYIKLVSLEIYILNIQVPIESQRGYLSAIEYLKQLTK